MASPTDKQRGNDEGKENGAESKGSVKTDVIDTEQAADQLIDSMERGMYIETAQKGAKEYFVETLASKFPLSLGEEFEDMNFKEQEEMLRDLIGEKAFKFYDQANSYLIHSNRISFYLKGNKGSTSYPLDLRYEQEMQEENRREIMEAASRKKPKLAQRPMLVVIESPEVLAERIMLCREETERFLRHYKKFERNYPELFEKLQKEHPGIHDLTKKVEGLADEFISQGKNFSKEELAQILIDYNFYAEQINQVMSAYEITGRSSRKDGFIKEVKVEDQGVKFTNEETKEVNKFAQEYWDELFPPSNVDQFMGWATGEDISKQGKLRWFFAPANGIESAVMGFASMFKLKTYTDLIDSVQYMYGMSYEDWCDTLKMFKAMREQVSMDDKINNSLSLICSMLFFGGGMAKMMTKINKLKCAPKLKKIIKSMNAAQSAEKFLRPFPIAAMGGMYLRYEDHDFIKRK